MALKNEFLKNEKNSQSNPNNDIIRYDRDFDYLINKGVPLDMQNQNKETLLHIAVWKGQIRSVKKLISLGAKLDIEDIDGNTPLHLAVIKQDIEMVKLLIKASGINTSIDIKNKNGDTPLEIGEKKEHKEIVFIISLLLSLFSFENINSANRELYKQFTSKLEELEKLEYSIFVRNSFNNEFKSCIDNLSKLEKDIDTLVIERKALENARKSRKWLNILTFGFYKRKITKKLMNNFEINFKKVVQLSTERDKIKNHIQELAKMIDKEKKLRTENEVLRNETKQLKKELQSKEKTLQDMNKKYEKIKQKIDKNKAKIKELEQILEKNEERIKELDFKNNEYKKVQNERNEKNVSKFTTLDNMLRAKEQEIDFFKENISILIRENAMLEKKLRNVSFDDSGIDLDEEVSSFDANKVNKDEPLASSNTTSEKKLVA
ncbi:ankyrin repeat domain-containing protein [Spiroplasma endosymbiont of Tricholauxania praeusta]|uniref:ankyrin repeat domain-containing protein n=1 Tax=Spiroplasma endosymbiont of Tricholauxania praeusta TaxID=3066296 RepID=UPI0030CAD425